MIQNENIEESILGLPKDKLVNLIRKVWASIENEKKKEDWMMSSSPKTIPQEYYPDALKLWKQEQKIKELERKLKYLQKLKGIKTKKRRRRKWKQSTFPFKVPHKPSLPPPERPMSPQNIET